LGCKRRKSRWGKKSGVGGAGGGGRGGGGEGGGGGAVFVISPGVPVRGGRARKVGGRRGNCWERARCSLNNNGTEVAWGGLAENNLQGGFLIRKRFGESKGRKHCRGGGGGGGWGGGGGGVSHPCDLGKKQLGLKTKLNQKEIA